MRKVFTLLLVFLMSGVVWGQTTILSDDFEDGNLAGWTQGTDGDWINSITSPITGSNSLKHNLSSVAGNSFIYADISGLDVTSGTTTWRFNLSNGSWDPSSENKFWVFLFGNETNLNGSDIDGYAVGVNLTGNSDLLTLWKVTNGAADGALITSSLDWNNNTLVGIEVVRTAIGSWELKYDGDGGFDNLISAGTAMNSDYTIGNYFGLSFYFTSTRAGLLRMDDVLIQIIEGANIPPGITNISRTPGQNILPTNTTVSVSADVEDVDGSISNVQLNWGTSSGNLNNTIQMTNTSGNTFATDQDIPAQAAGTTIYYEIEATDDEDATTSSVEQSYEVHEIPKLVISEVADPSDDVNARFVELFNLDNSEIDFSSGLWYLARQANGGSFSSLQLSGNILAEGVFVISYGADFSNFLTAYGYNPNLNSGFINGNGDDGYFLFYGGDHSTGYLVDAFGEIDVDGTGQAWEYEDSRAVRKITVTEPNSTWTADEWDIASANVADCDPGYYRNSGGSNSQVVSSTGTVDFNSGLTAVEFVIATLTGSDDVTVSKFTNPPSNVSGIAESNFSQYRWLMEVGAGITDIDTELRFYLAAIPNHGILEGDTGIRLYKRAVEGSGAFTLVGTFTYNDNGTVGDQSDDWLSIANVTSFSEFVFASDTSPLPVELTTFTANVFDGKVNLRWATATEVDNYGFEVQKSELRTQKSEGEWKVIGFVEGHGNSNSPKEYTFTDEITAPGKYSYRLKQIDTDGSFEYSNAVTVNAGDIIPEKFELSQNYPNPFNPVTKIQYSIPAVIASEAKQSVNATLKVYDIIGREVAVLVNESKEAGIYEVEFDATKLSSGLYFYSLSAAGKTITKKMMLLR